MRKAGRTSFLFGRLAVTVPCTSGMVGLGELEVELCVWGIVELIVHEHIDVIVDSGNFNLPRPRKPIVTSLLVPRDPPPPGPSLTRAFYDTIERRRCSPYHAVYNLSSVARLPLDGLVAVVRHEARLAGLIATRSGPLANGTSPRKRLRDPIEGDCLKITAAQDSFHDALAGWDRVRRENPLFARHLRAQCREGLEQLRPIDRGNGGGG